MKVALENFDFFKKDKKVVILGDMFELGDSANEEHQSIANLTSTLTFDKVLLIGENFYLTNTNATKLKSFEDLKAYLLENNLDPNSSILIKGSRGMALERVLPLL
jgi:UDP-N-acetylmuramoyl-tripeptide--D-alanyl-D-alanine ligase